jgi:hypothetical protein
MVKSFIEPPRHGDSEDSDQKSRKQDEEMGGFLLSGF